MRGSLSALTRLTIAAAHGIVLYVPSPVLVEVRAIRPDAGRLHRIDPTATVERI